MIFKIKTIILVVMLFPLSVMAKDYSEQSLKTLFTSQQQRQDVEGNRSAGDLNDDPSLIAPSSVQVNGVLKRSNGKSVVWLNGKSTMDSTMVDGVKVYSNSINSKYKVPVMIDGRKVYIKPGETWSVETGVSGVGD